MFKALMKKKLWEFRASNGRSGLPVLFVISLLPLVRLFSDAPWAMFVSLFPFIELVGFVMAVTCAALAFQGDFANQTGRFLEYLPLRRSAIWLVSYLSGIGLLGLAAVSLFSIKVLLFPMIINTEALWHGEGPPPELTHLFPSRFALAVSYGSILFWLFSISVFSAAYLRKQNSPANNANAGGMVLGALAMPVVVIVFLAELGILPSGLELSPVLLTSGALYTAGSFALFALVPKHITPAKHGLLGMALFLAVSAGLVFQIYQKHIEWRVLDPSQPLRVTRVYKPNLHGEPDLILADVRACRSGGHCVSISMKLGTYHDLGRGMELLEVPENDSGLLHFTYTSNVGFRHFSSDRGYFASMAPDGTKRRSFKIPRDRASYGSTVRWLPDRELLVYPAWVKASKRTFLHVADSSGRLLKRFEMGDSHNFLVNAAGQVLAIAPTKTAGDMPTIGKPTSDEKPYMMIDLDSGSIHRFGLPGHAFRFAKDFSRVICMRTRVENGRRYQSHTLIELPSLDERSILSEDEFPSQEVSSQVDASISANVPAGGGGPTSFMQVNDAFDIALWVKQRVDGDDFRYSIILIDLDTGRQQVVVPESATPSVPIVITEATRGAAITVDRFTADRAAFTYWIGPRAYLCDIETRQSVLLADHGIALDPAEEEMQISYDRRPTLNASYSPSGRRVLRHGNVREELFGDRPRSRLKFAAVEVFESGKPKRLHTGQRSINGALWLDEERIVFYEEEAIFVLESAGGAPRQIFPPIDLPVAQASSL